MNWYADRDFTNLLASEKSRVGISYCMHGTHLTPFAKLTWMCSGTVLDKNYIVLQSYIGIMDPSYRTMEPDRRAASDGKIYNTIRVTQRDDD